MPLNISRFGPSPDVKVFIQNSEGKFLARGDQSWVFTENRSAATVFHYDGDRVADQLEALRQTQGIVLTAVPVPLQEIYESCDRCHDFFMPSMIRFDGQHFLCPDCFSRAARLTAASRRPRKP
jgi:hypothetical protein